MNVVDLHPEELLDKDARGELSEDERGRLGAHLARCAACRAERLLRADFAEELEGDDRPSAVHGLIQGALAADGDADGYHPEELLDKEARFALSEDERARLGAHRAGCAPCRAERVLRADFAADFAEDAEGDALAALVERALDAAGPRADIASAPKARDVEPRDGRQKPEPLVELASVQGLRRRPRRTAVVLLFAAAVLAASAASATGVTARVWLRLTGGSLDATRTEQESTSAAPAARARGAAPSVVAAPSALGSVATVDGVEPSSPAVDSPAAEAVAPSSEALAASPVVASSAAASPLAIAPQPSTRGAFGAPSPAPSAPAPVTPAPAAALSPAASAVAPPSPSASALLAATPAPVAMSASELFDAANAARRAGDTGAALARYEALEKQYPASREGRLVAATSARLLLDRGDAEGALRRFDAYLAGGSSELREEAMAGRATALERLGQDADEARAWAALLATYPHTPYAAHARARVARSSAR